MRLFSAAVFVLLSVAVFAQSPHYKIGRPPTPEEVKAWDIAIGPDGRELPPGRGTVARGKAIYVEQCARCHGATATEGPEMPLAGGKGTLNSDKPLKTVGSYWPYATTLFDYINRAMPIGKEGSLKPDEVYALTAYLLFKNGVIPEDGVMDAQSLPKVVMPNKNGFALPQPEWERAAPRLRNYP